MKAASASPPSLPERPQVSVLMISYNHAAYIQAALENVLMQRGNFDLTVIVGDDCSPDGTAAVVAAMAANHPDQVLVLPRERNLGPSSNFGDVFAHCDGDLMAICEGDDYWTDPNKIQLQIAALRTHPHWSMCFHAVDVEVDGGGPLPDSMRGYPESHPGNDGREFTVADLLARNSIPTCSALLRRPVLGPRLPDWMDSLSLSDWPTFLLQTFRGGPAGYLDRRMATYRIHAAGTWSVASEAARALATYQMFAAMRRHLELAPYDATLHAREVEFATIALHAIAREPTPASARRMLQRLFATGAYRHVARRRTLARVVARLYFRLPV